MPSIYKQLKNSDRKFIRTEKARIRRQFLDFKKQEEMISELYSRLIKNNYVKASDTNQEVGTSLNPKSQITNPKQISNSKSKIQKKETKKTKEKKVASEKRKVLQSKTLSESAHPNTNSEHSDKFVN